ncbi:MAG: hypothetical protein FWD68_11620 [Alphaproteobacteria bacterium]|nr:hypothetical protein [Alphaproteobacteria bacterium]
MIRTNKAKTHTISCGADPAHREAAIFQGTLLSPQCRIACANCPGTAWLAMQQFISDSMATGAGFHEWMPDPTFEDPFHARKLRQAGNPPQAA